MDIDQILAQAKKPERTVPMCLRADLQATWEDLEREFNRADNEITDEVLSSGASSKTAKIALEMEKIRREMEEATVVFRLRAVPRKRWQQIVRANPPGEEIEAEVDEEGFVTALIAACCIEPEMTLLQAADLRDAITDGQWQELANVAWQLNKGMTTVPFSLAASTRLALAATEQ